MPKCNSFSRAAIFITLGSLCPFLFPRPAAAGPVTYTYTGNPFTFFTGGVTCPPDCSVSVSFTLPSQLEDNFLGGGKNISVTPTSFSFTDGDVTISSGEPGVFVAHFFLQTNSKGAIVAWLMDVSIPVFTSNCLFCDNQLGTGNGTGDVVVIATMGAAPNALAAILNNPGTWACSGCTPTPEPSSLLLLSIGLLGLGPFIRRRIPRA